MTTASVKLTPEEMFQLRQDAATRRMTISDYLRAAIAAMKPKPRHRSRLEKRDGRYVVVHPPGTPPITDADISAVMDQMDVEYFTGKTP